MFVLEQAGLRLLLGLESTKLEFKLFAQACMTVVLSLGKSSRVVMPVHQYLNGSTGTRPREISPELATLVDVHPTRLAAETLIKHLHKIAPTATKT